MDNEQRRHPRLYLAISSYRFSPGINSIGNFQTEQINLQLKRIVQIV